MKILVIEDEQSLRENITNYLNVDGNLCESCSALNPALQKLSDYDYDCVLLDIGLPDGEGFDVLEYLRANQKNEGVLIISARNSLEDRLKGLDVGADDYLTKPFHLAELKARLMAVYRRKALNTNNKLIFNEITIDVQGRTVEVNETAIILTRKEYDMLLYFIYTHVKNLRRKLLDAGGKDYLISIYGIGYKFIG